MLNLYIFCPGPMSSDHVACACPHIIDAAHQIMQIFHTISKTKDQTQFFKHWLSLVILCAGGKHTPDVCVWLRLPEVPTVGDLIMQSASPNLTGGWVPVPPWAGSQRASLT